MDSFSAEILDVDGRIGGFNFQWAWASGYLAGNSHKRLRVDFDLQLGVFQNPGTKGLLYPMYIGSPMG